MLIFHVPQGISSILIEDGAPGQGAPLRNYLTRKDSAFLEHEVVIDPEGKVGSWGPAHETVGGNYARKGYYGFRRVHRGAVLLVPARHVRKEQP